MKRAWWTGLILVVAAAAAASEPPRRSMSSDCSPRETPPTAKAARQRWAQARMDEMANERLRCRERLRDAQQVAQCEAAYDRRFRLYNEMYLEATRE